MVTRYALRLIAIGSIVGVAGSLVATRLLESMLYGVSPWDPATFAGVTVVLSFVGFAACVLPAWRATRVDPGVTLKYE